MSRNVYKNQELLENKAVQGGNESLNLNEDGARWNHKDYSPRTKTTLNRKRKKMEERESHHHLQQVKSASNNSASKHSREKRKYKEEEGKKMGQKRVFGKPAAAVKKRGDMSKYGLNLRPAKQKKQPPRPPLTTPFGFNDDDDNDVEREIALQASKNKTLKEVEEQQKKALEEDPTIFDYDGVYDKMKEKVTRPLVQDREERKPKYIQNLIKKAKEREQYRDIVYEKKIAKERSKDDHLYADKDKFITEAYRKKLAERERQMELERLHELQEERDDVTKKKDFLLDFYANLDKNVAYGAKDAQGRKHDDRAEQRIPETRKDMNPDASNRHQHSDASDEVRHSLGNSSSPVKSSMKNIVDQGETSNPSISSINPLDMKPNPEGFVQEKSSVEQSSASQPKLDHHKRSQDALAAAKERFLTRKKAKEQ